MNDQTRNSPPIALKVLSKRDALVNKEHLESDLELVDRHSRLDAVVPEISTMRGLKRHFAVWAAKMFLYFSRVFTKRQSQVNISTLNTLRNFAHGFDRVESSLREINRDLMDLRTSLLSQEYRLNTLLSGAINSDSEKVNLFSSEAAHSLDAYYLAFENRFRGSRDEVKEKLRVYLPIIKELREEFDGLSALDIGCGRGEWLELMKENRVDAVGVDTNRIQLEECLRHGLSVAEGDLLEYLKKTPAGSLCLVTGFHVIEHVPFPMLVQIFDEAFRVLKPGGMVIFETPNSENTDVGASLFYSDPTHEKPLFPEAVKFLAEQRGYIRLEIYRIPQSVPSGAPQPLPTEHPLAAHWNPLAETVRSRFFSAKDFAVIARKGQE